MNFHQLLEAWNLKGRQRKRLEKLNRYSKAPIESKIAIETESGRVRRVPIQNTDLQKEFLRLAFRGSRMLGNPITSSSPDHDIMSGYEEFMAAQDRNFAQLDAPERRERERNILSRILNRRKR